MPRQQSQKAHHNWLAFAHFAQGNHVRVAWAHSSGLACLPSRAFCKMQSMPPSQAYHGMKNDLLMMSFTPINTQRFLAIYGHGNRVVWAAQGIVKFVLIPWLFYGLPIGNENLFQWQLAKYEILWSVPKFVYVILFFGQFQVICWFLAPEWSHHSVLVCIWVQ
jgi:hypothetical protein